MIMMVIMRMKMAKTSNIRKHKREKKREKKRKKKSISTR